MRNKLLLIKLIICIIIFTGILNSGINNENISDGYSALFSGKAYLSEVLLFDMGSLVLKFTHPLSHHRDTKMKEKMFLNNGDVKVVFDTEYRSWRKGNTMIWSIVFSGNGIPKDIRFIKDSGTFKTGNFYNRVKNNILVKLRSITRNR